MSRSLCNCCKAMKRKLPGKNFLYEEFNLGEVQELQSNLWNPWTKHSLIGLLITIYSKKKYLTNNVRISTLLSPRRSRRSEKNSNNKFVLFVLLAASASIYRSNSQTIVEPNNLGFIKIRDRIRSQENYTGIYRNYFLNFNNKFNIFLHAFFSLEGIQKLHESCLFDSNFDSIKNYQALEDKNMDDPRIFFGSRIKIQKNNWEHHLNPVFFDRFAKNQEKYSLDSNQIFTSTFPCEKFLSKGSFDQEKYDPIFESSLFKGFFHPSKKKMMNSFWCKKHIFWNLRNWGESEETLVKSYVSLDKRYLIFNDIKLHFREFLEKSFYNLKKKQQLLRNEFAEKQYDLANEPGNAKSLIILENFMSDCIYQSSRSVLPVEIPNHGTMGIDAPGSEPHRYIDCIGSSHVNVYGKSELLDLSKYGTERAKKESYVRSVSFAKTMHSDLLNHSSFPKERLDPIRESLVNESSTNSSFLPRNTIKTFSELFHYVSSELLPRNESKLFINKNSGSVKRTPGNSRVSDYARIKNLWRIRKYHSKILWNYDSSINPEYIMIKRNNFLDKKILYIFRENQLLPRILHSLLSISPNSEGLRIFINCIGSEKRSLRNRNGLDIPMEDGEEDPESNEALQGFNWQSSNSNRSVSNSNVDRTNSNGNESINNFHFVGEGRIRYCFKSIVNPIRIKFRESYDPLQSSYNKLFGKSLINLFLEKEESTDSMNFYIRIINAYSTTWKRTMHEGFIRSISYIAYNELIFEVHEWVDRINNWGGGDYLKVLVSCDSRIKTESPMSLSKIFRIFVFKSINQVSSSIQTYAFNAYEIDFEKNALVNQSKKYSNCEMLSSNVVDYSQNPTYEFVSSSGGANTKYYSSIQLQLLNLFLKHNEFASTINRTYYSFRKTAPVAQPRLSSTSSSRSPHKNFGKNNFLFFPDLFEKCSSQKNSEIFVVLDRVCLERRIDETKTVFDYPEIRDLCRKPEDWGVSTSLQNVPGAKTHCNVLRSGVVVDSKNDNNRIFQSINYIFIHPEPKSCESKTLEYIVDGKELGNMSELCLTYRKYKGFKFFARYISFNNYTSWFFTSEWWEYHIYVFIEKCREVPPIISYYFNFFMERNIEVIQKNLQNLLGVSSQNSKLKLDSRLPIDSKEEETSDSLWSNPELVNHWSGLHWAILTLIVCLSFYHRNYFPILIGSNYMDLWKNFGIVKYLTDTSRAFHFTKLVQRNKARLSKTENIVIHFLRDLPHYTRNIRFYLLTNKKLKGWLIKHKSLDLSRRKRDLLIQSLVTNTKLKGYGFRSYSKQKLLSNRSGYRVTHGQGLLYLWYLAKILKKKLVVNYSLHLADKWILFASLQRIILSRTLWQTKKLDLNFHKIPIPLEFGSHCSKSILLVGPIETGRSYLVKNLAAESCAPLLKVSINKLLYNKPDVVTENWMNILIESLRRLNLILDLAGKMSPCMVWIQDIHQLDVNRSTQNVESDPTFLLGILLKHFRTDSLRTRIENNIIVIGSTHIPRKVDPALISPNRLDRIINIRLFDNSQRRNQFPVLLNKSNFRLKKNLLYFNEFESRTMGYNVRDLAALTNEVLLVSIAANESSVHTGTLRFAFHRQIFGSTHKNHKPSFQRDCEIALYKIGRAVAQNTLVKDFAMNPLNISNYLCKNKFHYLFEWYSESSIDESIVKESAILTHVLGCLAGAAARDSLLLSKKHSDASIPLDKLVGNDFNLASSILESLSMEFPWLETCETRSVGDREKKITILPTSNILNIMQNGVLAMGNRSGIHAALDGSCASMPRQKHFIGKRSESRSTAWSPRVWRLSFLRSQLFDWIKRFNDFDNLLSSESSRRNEHFFCPKNSGGRGVYSQLAQEKKEQLLYERILPRVRERNIQELESQFEDIFSEEQSKILGFFGSSTEYRIEYQLDNRIRLFIGKRILWDPIGSLIQMRHSVFSRRDFFVDEETLRRLYVTYGARRERERSRSSHTIKQFFLCQGYNNDSISKLSVRWCNRVKGQHSIVALKRIEEMGIRLKRPRIFTPVYLYQRWLIENLPEKYPRFELLTHQQRWLRFNNPLLNDSFVHTTLSESYKYLLGFFLSNRVVLNQMLKLLFMKGWLFRNDIVGLIRNTK